jgi:hypothetical protein
MMEVNPLEAHLRIVICKYLLKINTLGKQLSTIYFLLLSGNRNQEFAYLCKITKSPRFL